MIDLHAHLGSLTTPINLWRIMNRNGISVGVKTYEEFLGVINGMEKDNYEKYLKKFEVTHKIQSNPQSVEECVYYAVEDAYINHGLSGIEIRFNPMFRNQGGHFNLDAVILYACIGLQKALESFPIKAGIIISTDKSFSVGQHMILLEKALKYKYMGVIGIDCSGLTTDIEDIKRLEKMYTEAHGHIGKTVHAGETYNMLDEVKIAVNDLGVSRIGHGIQAYRDESLTKSLADNDICLEICPVSNISNGIFRDYYDLSDVVELYDKMKVPMTFNTDGTVFLKTSLAQQFYMSYDLEMRVPIIHNIYDKIKENSNKYTFIK